MDARTVARKAKDYLHIHSGSEAEPRTTQYARLVNDYYDLATDFYEIGWGRSFHFGPIRPGERYATTLARHQHFLADRLNLRAGMRVLDAGCGVGGPLREIAHHSRAQIVGLNNNLGQVERARRYNAATAMASECEVLHGDFMNIPAEDESFDRVYAIESTCHAPKRVDLFREFHRVLKPGGEFASYEWCLTSNYDPQSAAHREMKKDIEVGNGLPDLETTEHVTVAAQEAGFEVLETRDLADPSVSPIPWYRPLAGSQLSPRGLMRSPVGRALTNGLTWALESMRVAPEGTRAVSSFLNQGADALVAAGEAQVFTPMFFLHARKAG